MEAKTGFVPTQVEMGTKPGKVPPSAMPTPGQVHSVQAGQSRPVQWIPTPLIFVAKEEFDFCDRQRKRSSRDFIMHIVNNEKQEVMRVVRPSHQCDGSNTVAVEAPPGHPIGHIRQRSIFYGSYFEVLDASLKTLLKIRGPCCFCDGGNVDFRLMTPDDSQQIGKISKQYTDYIQEMYTKADNFSVVFPMDLDVKVKATLLGAVFLIDFIYFERTPAGAPELRQ